jgi:hypothetical protein
MYAIHALSLAEKKNGVVALFGAKGSDPSAPQPLGDEGSDPLAPHEHEAEPLSGLQSLDL